MKKNKVDIKFGLRKYILLFLGAIVLRRPFLWIMKLLPGYFDYIFFVYPGQKSEIVNYLPKFLVDSSWCRTQIFFGGIITSSQDSGIGRGILMGAPSTVKSMVKSSDECNLLKKRIQRIAKSFSIKKVALAGRAPTIFLRNNVLLDNPFVHGRMGMVFCTIETLYHIADKHNVLLKESNIVVFGAGDVGKSISNFLLSEGYTTKNVRSKTVFNYNNQQLPETVKDVLGVADIIVVISATGADFHPYMKYLKDNAIIVGETHPPIRRPFARGVICRAAVSLDGLEFVPPLYSYGDTSIPGCLLEAIMLSKHGSITDQKTFNQLARGAGFQAKVVE